MMRHYETNKEVKVMFGRDIKNNMIFDIKIVTPEEYEKNKDAYKWQIEFYKKMLDKCKKGKDKKQCLR